MKLKKIFKIVILICLITIIIDQTSKILISNFVKKDIIILQDVFSLSKVENEGIAFGLNKQNMGNIGLCLIVLIVMINYLISQKDKMTPTIIVFLSLIISGGISNLIDRIFKGYVFDFIKIAEFPVFNIADICIVIGWFLFLMNFLKETVIDIKAMKQIKKDKTK